MTTNEYKEKYNITVEKFDIKYVTTQQGPGPCAAHAFATLLNMYYETDEFKWDQYWDAKNETTLFDYNFVDTENFYTSESDFLLEIKKYLDLGIPVQIVVYSDNTHFVNAIGYELDENGDFTFDGIVITDSGTSGENKVCTIEEAYTKYKYYEYNDDFANRHGYRIIKPYIINEQGEFILDEYNNKTTNPYYLDPIRDSNGKIISSEEAAQIVANTKKAIEDCINATNLKPHEKEILIEQMIKVFKRQGVGVRSVTSYVNESGVRANLKAVTHAVSTARNTRYDPLILDLDGDGFNVETKENGTNFDLDKNGLAEKINWTRKDGILCLDLNGNGKVDNGGEVFGDWTILPDGARAKNGFEALAQYDSNEDGFIDENDEIFSQLRVWVDADGDGISGNGELKTLSELGIVSINLGYENVNAETGTEATIGNSATFTRDDGTTGGVGELWVSSDLFDTVDRLDIEISDEIAALPDVKSIGNVYSLRTAIALDDFVNISPQIAYIVINKAA